MKTLIKDLYRLLVTELKNSKIPTPELDARLIIQKILKNSQEKFYSNLNLALSPAQIKKILSLIERRKKQEPIAYILEKKEFFGLDFEVNNKTLIPRPETEWLVEKSLEILKKRFAVNSERLTILDMGTGSGNIIISIANTFRHFKQCEYYASDISDKALNIALKNAKNHQADINFIQSDLFKNIERELKFDLIIANLPYVPFESKPTTDYRLPISYEPQKAIFANDNGAEIIKRFLLEVKDRLNNSGTILIELDPRNASEIKNFSKNIFNKVELEKDLAGFDRYLILTF